MKTLEISWCFSSLVTGCEMGFIFLVKTSWLRGRDLLRIMGSIDAIPCVFLVASYGCLGFHLCSVRTSIGCFWFGVVHWVFGFDSWYSRVKAELVEKEMGEQSPPGNSGSHFGNWVTGGLPVFSKRDRWSDEPPCPCSYLLLSQELDQRRVQDTTVPLIFLLLHGSIGLGSRSMVE